jgi:hypothetical protein
MAEQIIPNRWHTSITVEVYTENQPSVFKTFSDMQMAYMWIRSQINHELDSWYVKSFEESCVGLDISYVKRGLRGNYCVAQSIEGEVRDYLVFYGVLTF